MTNIVFDVLSVKILYSHCFRLTQVPECQVYVTQGLVHMNLASKGSPFGRPFVSSYQQCHCIHKHTASKKPSVKSCDTYRVLECCAVRLEFALARSRSKKELTITKILDRKS